MVNPNPGRITDEMYRLWEERPNKAWKLGGIFADKSGYHNTVYANQSRWPTNYSIKLSLDLIGDKTKSRAIDYTMSESEMIRVTRLLKRSAEDPRDNRLAAVREFYGTLDGKTVFGLSKHSTSKGWLKSSADISHLWHLHMSIFTRFINSWPMLRPILSVLAGETYEEWITSSVFLPVEGNSGEPVKYWQYIHNKVRNTVSPPSPALVVDGDYGKKTVEAFKDFWYKIGGKGTFTGTIMTGWLASEYMEAHARVSNPSAAATEDQITKAVNKWLETKLPQSLVVIGEWKGKVQL